MSLRWFWTGGRFAFRVAYAFGAVSLCLSALTAQAQTLDLPANLTGLERQLRNVMPGGQLHPEPAPLDVLRERSVPQRGMTGDPRDYFGLQQPKEEPFSPLERDYSARMDREMRQFGYDFVRPTPEIDTAGVTGVVPDDYVLGVGDELVVTLRGQVNRTEVARIDREGRLVLADLAPVVAAGRPLGEVREDMEAQIASAFIQTRGFVSLGTIRTVRVLVGGEVVQPGQRTLTSFSSILDALIASGGVRKTGSLRNLRIIRQGAVVGVDLYTVLLGEGAPADIRLRDGDQIIVPPLGATVAVAGDVIRPGIYELPPSAGQLGLDRVMAMAGGAQRSRGNRITLVRLDSAGRNDRQVLEQPSATVRASDIVLVERPHEAVKVDGAVAGSRELGLPIAPTLRSLLSSPDLLQADPYLPLAVIQTEDPVTRVRRYVPVDLDRAFAGDMNVTLRPRDRVIILGREEVEYLASADVQAVLAGEIPPVLQIDRNPLGQSSRGGQGVGVGQLAGSGAIPQGVTGQPQNTQLQPQQQPMPQPKRRPWEEPTDEPVRQIPGLVITDSGDYIQTRVSCAGLRQLATMVGDTRDARFGGGIRLIQTRSVANIRTCPELFDRYPDLLPFLIEYAAAVEGAVRAPGIYPVLPGTSAATLLQAAGGVSLEADSSSIDVTTTAGERLSGLGITAIAGVVVTPGSVIRVNPRPRGREVGFIEIAGEVTRPGRLDIRPGERLSDALRRAGGLSQDAYAYGAVFTRERVRVAEKQGFERAARELESSIPAAMVGTSEEAAAARAALPALQALANSLRSAEAVGRIVVEADPLVLAARPELDMILEAGDRIFIPKRPTHVTVTGDVLNPSSLMFRSGEAAQDYIRRAGGFTANADRGAAFVVLPNGEAVPLELRAWRGRQVQIPPGSTIVVPRDPRPFDFLTLSRSITSLVSDLAIAAASIAVISR